MTGYSAMSGLCLNRFAVGRHQNRGHQAQRAKALRNLIRLHIAIIVFAGPNKLARPFQCRGNHVVDQTVLIYNARSSEFLFKAFGFKNFLKQVFETAVIGFQNRVLGRQIDRPAKVKAIVERRTGEIADGIVQIVHRHSNAAAGEFEHFQIEILAIVAIKDQTQCARARYQCVSCAILVTKGMATDDNRIGPARNQAGNILDHNGFTKYNAAQNVADGAVRRLPHFFQTKFFDAGFIRRDRRAFYADAIFTNGIGAINCNLVVGRIARLNAKVIIFQINIQIGQNQPFTDPFPDDPGHFIAIQFDDGVFHLDFCHGFAAFLRMFMSVIESAIARFC